MDIALPPLHSPAARRELARFVWAATVGSTQDWAMAEPVPAQGTAVFAAGHQRGGRGRRGRVWHSPPGAALALSLLRGFAGPLATVAPVGLAVALASADALRRAGLAGVGVKWPNDLVLGEAKLGGLLVEVRASRPRPVLVIGLGVNRALPEDTPIDQAWTDLERAGLRLPEAALLGLILEAVLPALARFDAEGLAPFVEAWPAFDVLAGRRVRLLAGRETLEGLALGLAADGGLRVFHAEGERVHHAGEVSVRVAA